MELCNFHVKNTRNDSDTRCVSKSALTIIITFIVIMRARKPIILYFTHQESYMKVLRSEKSDLRLIIIP